MNRTTELFKSEAYLQNNLRLFVNRATEDFNVPFHSHEFIEYCYVAQGKGYHHIENETFPVHKGMLYVIPVGISHVFRPSTPGPAGEPLIVYNCLFDNYMVDRLSPILLDDPVQEHLKSLCGGNERSSASSYFNAFDRDGSIESIMQRLYREMSVPSIGSATMLLSLVSQLAITVYRLKYGDADKRSADAADFTNVIQYIGEHLSEPITLSDLSHISRWSIRHLQRLFQRHSGQSFGSYLQNARIHKSCELLRGSSRKVSVIAELVGYRDIDSFNAVFKKIVGQSPSEYRSLQGG
ncbi:AraC family transcriptional regulator [Paenibacillus harenae]|uniref:AraC family L-rhamnose operon transcriptional activator RhaR n=1 Tax=Paenibacillus harenae TaxID=306543 RepID=A0ABT9TZP0_PAEHA|nr:AraC family transcriptional regulator [Paenibacillus harenae]MDQ0060285.1 AraC family L-rhamnose operon transcriptional activator RhaR [Paenibacillus harenae]MDQ0112178.1 AraC family L-rhamnose operon transcriptional activator RhaR [Paenibacillus harenae]